MPDNLDIPPVPRTGGVPEARATQTGFRARWAVMPDNLRGGLLFMLAAALLSVMAALIKLAGQHLHVSQILFFRQLTIGVIALPPVIAGWPASLRTARPGLQLARVGLAFTAMTLGFSAIVHLPLAEATVISFSRSFFVTLLAIVLLGEIVRLPRWAGLAAGFAGVMLVVWPEPGAAPGIWHLAAICSALCVSTVQILIRVLTRVDRPVTILSFQAVGVGLLMVPPMLWFWRTPEPWEWGLLAAIGVISAGAQYLNILAMRAAEASALAPLEYTRLIFATLLGLWMFAEFPEPRVWVGAAVIVAAALFVLYRERRAAMRRRGL